MKVQLTDWAKSNLKDIHNYYKVKASSRVANNIKSKIIASIKSLPICVEKFQEEEQLSKLNLHHRRFSEGNFKIIYRLDKKKLIVTDIFDTRQDPTKMNG